MVFFVCKRDQYQVSNINISSDISHDETTENNDFNISNVCELCLISDPSPVSLWGRRGFEHRASNPTL